MTKILAKKEFLEIINKQITEYINALNYWGKESGKTDNREARQKECTDNVVYFKTAIQEFSVFESKMHSL